MSYELLAISYALSSLPSRAPPFRHPSMSDNPFSYDQLPAFGLAGPSARAISSGALVLLADRPAIAGS